MFLGCYRLYMICLMKLVIKSPNSDDGVIIKASLVGLEGEKLVSLTSK